MSINVKNANTVPMSPRASHDGKKPVGKGVVGHRLEKIEPEIDGSIFSPNTIIETAAEFRAWYQWALDQQGTESVRCVAFCRVSKEIAEEVQKCNILPHDLPQDIPAENCWANRVANKAKVNTYTHRMLEGEWSRSLPLVWQMDMHGHLHNGNHTSQAIIKFHDLINETYIDEETEKECVAWPNAPENFRPEVVLILGLERDAIHWIDSSESVRLVKDTLSQANYFGGKKIIEVDNEGKEKERGLKPTEIGQLNRLLAQVVALLRRRAQNQGPRGSAGKFLPAEVEAIVSEFAGVEDIVFSTWLEGHILKERGINAGYLTAIQYMTDEKIVSQFSADTVDKNTQKIVDYVGKLGDSSNVTNSKEFGALLTFAKSKEAGKPCDVSKVTEHTWSKVSLSKDVLPTE